MIPSPPGCRQLDAFGSSRVGHPRPRSRLLQRVRFVESAEGKE
jgi:hypothetical protein